MYFLLLLLLGTIVSAKAHVIYGKDPGRLSRYPFDDWSPIREASGYSRHVQPYMMPPRFPLQHGNKAHPYTPSKRIMTQPVAENSDTVEVFSPAPPSILGSFSVFGHATVNAREPASHIAKKSPHHQLPIDYSNYERQKPQGYQTRNQYGSSGFYQSNEPQILPNRFNDYNDGYSFESTLRPPPAREANKKVSSYSSGAQSTALPPNAYYYEQPHSFQPSAIDNSYEKIRKPISSYHYGSTPAFSTPKPVDYRTNFNNDYDQSPASYYKSFNNKGVHPSPQPTSSWNNNPFGDITFGTRRPAEYVKPVTEEKEPAKDIYTKNSHLSRPFQGSQYTTVMDTQREVETYPPYITTYPSTSETQNVKFSEEAQPFQANNDYRTQGVPFTKPDYVVTQDPFNQEVYPITVTTIDVPTESETRKKVKNKNRGESHFSEANTLPGPSSQNEYNPPLNRQPGVEVVSYQGYNGKLPPPFLPTPTPDSRPSAPQPTMFEETTNQPEDSSNAQDFNYISTLQNRYRDNIEEATEIPATTTFVVDTTTTPTTPKTRPTIKSRRRPSRPPQKTTESTRTKNNQLLEDEYSTSVDIQKHQRRRKPNNKYRDSSEYKRYRTTTTSTTTTTSAPIEVATEANEYTTLEEEPNQMSDNYFARPFNDFTNYGYYSSYNEDRSRPKENVFSSQPPPTYMHNLSYADIFRGAPTTNATTTTTLAPTTILTTLPTRTTTTSTTTTITHMPVSVTPPSIVSKSSLPARLKNKYGNNRPRFSVKEYKDRMNQASSSTSNPIATEDETTPQPKNDGPKILSRMRPSIQRPTTTEPPQIEIETSEPKYRKYKPRLGPSRNFYKTSTTPQADQETTTTERVNTFRPSTNRYKPGTGKYYSRYRTSSIPPKEVDDSPFTTTAKITIKPKGVFSAKRRPQPMKSRQNEEEEDNSFENSPPLNYGDSLKINENEVVPSVASKKMDDATTTTMMSSEEKDVHLESYSKPSTSNVPGIPPSGSEAMRIADLTSSSSNDFNSANIVKPIVVPVRRVISKIMIPTEEPILPLEAFFQTRKKNK